MMVTPLYLAALAVLLAASSDGARILGMFPMWARSHHRFIQPVMKSLANAGHEVVVYSPFPLDTPHPNYTDVLLENIGTDTKGLQEFFLEIADFPEWKCIDSHLLLYKWMYKEFIEDPKIIELISRKEKFDIILIEANTIQEYVLVLGHILKAPIISLQAFFLNNLVNNHAGNDLSLSYVPDVSTSLSNRMSFQERLFNTFSSLRGLYYYYNDLVSNLDKLMREEFPDMPPLKEMAKNVSLYFVNDHATADYAQPRPPNIVSVGGIHIVPPKPLPKEIQRFMDDAPAGVIFFSLGTYVADELQPKEYFDMYIKIFKKFKQKVIWKTRKENIQGLPKNVLTLKWAPQQDILAHQNCILFITHGGLLSQHEAVYFGVPVVGIPQFYDQDRNVRYYLEQGVGVRVNDDDITETTMTAAIQKVLLNPSYRENMKRLSAIFRDRPLSPAESVVFWTEYVLRHGGAAHLRPASTELRWYQLILLDITGLLLVIVLILVLIIYIFCCKIRDYFVKSKNVPKDKIKKWE